LELCNRSYGFFDIPSLAVFINPFSHLPQVPTQLTAPIEEALAALDAEGSADLLQRFATLLHERRHFHDVLATPFGNRIFRSYLAYAVLCSSVFMRRGWTTEQISVPLRPPDVSPEDLAVVEEKQRQVLGQLEIGRPAFELSAMLVQVQAAWSLLSADAAQGMIDDLLGHSHERELVEAALLWNQDASVFRDRLHRAITKTTVAIGFGSTGAPDISTGTTLKHLLHRIHEIATPATEAAVRQIEAAAEAAWRQLLINLDEADAANDRLVQDVEKQLVVWPKEAAAAVVSVARGFADEARRCHAIARDEPERLIDAKVYLERGMELPQPRCYFFCDNDAQCVSDEPLDLDRPSLAWQSEYTLEDGVKKYCHRLFPGNPLPPPAWEIPGQWEEYAKGVVGPTALFEPVNWNHPFRAYSLRTIGSLTKVKLVRRMM